MLAIGNNKQDDFATSHPTLRINCDSLECRRQLRPQKLFRILIFQVQHRKNQLNLTKLIPQTLKNSQALETIRSFTRREHERYTQTAGKSVQQHITVKNSLKKVIRFKSISPQIVTGGCIPITVQVCQPIALVSTYLILFFKLTFFGHGM